LKLDHIIPLIFLQHYFNEDLYKNFTGASRARHRLNITLPDLNIVESDYSKEIENLDGLSVKMVKFANKSREQGLHFQTLSHKLSWDLAQAELHLTADSLTIFSPQYWINMGSLILASASLLAAAILYCKFRSIALALALMSRGARAEVVNAITPLVFEFQTPPTTPPPAMFTPKLSEHTSLAEVILIALFLVFWIHLAYKLFRRFHPDHSFTLYAEIGNATDSVKIPVATLRHTPDLYSFNASQFVKDVRMCGLWMPRLQLHWPDLKISSRIAPVTHILSPRHRVSWPTALKLRQILLTDFHVLLFTKQADSLTYYLVNIEGTTWSQFKHDRPQNDRKRNLYPPLTAPPYDAEHGIEMFHM
jgi:hypothetical protein